MFALCKLTPVTTVPTEGGFLLIGSENTLHPIAALRAQLGITQEEFGARIGLKTKGSVSLIERGLAAMSPEVALAIEELSEGAIDASGLNPIIAKARGIVWAQEGRHGHGLPDSAEMEQNSTGQSNGLSGECHAPAPTGAASTGRRCPSPSLPGGGTLSQPEAM